MTDIFDGYAYQKELLPCPFCGVNKEVPPYVIRENQKHIGLVYMVSCSNCGCTHNGCVETIEEAIRFWNTRNFYEKTVEFINGFNAARETIIKLINELHVRKKR